MDFGDIWFSFLALYNMLEIPRVLHMAGVQVSNFHCSDDVLPMQICMKCFEVNNLYTFHRPHGCFALFCNA
jgi:hypothetical protein